MMRKRISLTNLSEECDRVIKEFALGIPRSDQNYEPGLSFQYTVICCQIIMDFLNKLAN